MKLAFVKTPGVEALYDWPMPVYSHMPPRGWFVYFNNFGPQNKVPNIAAPEVCWSAGMRRLVAPIAGALREELA